MENQVQSKKIVILFIAVVLLGGLTLFLDNITKRKVTQQKASGSAPVTVFLDPPSRQVSAGETFEVKVAMTSTVDVQTNVAGTEITYDPTKVTISDLKCLSPYTVADFTTIGSNRLTITCHAPPPTQPVLSSGQSYPFGSFKVTVKPSVSGSISLGIDRSLTLIPEVTNETYLDMTGSTAGAEYTIGGGNEEGPVTFYLDPGNGSSIKKGQGSVITVKMTSRQSVGINVGDLRIAFDPNVLEISNITCGATFPVAGQAQVINSMIYLACGRQGGTGAFPVSTTPVELGKFTVTPKSAAVVGNTTNLIFNQTIAADGSGNDYAGTGGTVSYTITAAGEQSCTDGTVYGQCSNTKPKFCNTSGQLVDACGAPNNCGCPAGQICQANGSCLAETGAITLKFSIRSQGIFQKRADQKVTVRIKKGALDKVFTDVDLVADNSGIYSGQVVLSGVVPGTGYAVFIKGPRHLAKKLCVNNQSADRRCGESAAISLVAGVNTFNWSTVIMDGGDLPGTSGQDGVVNSADWTLMNGKLGSSLAADLVMADINLDGIVNATDRVLLRNTLETKYEEDY